MQCLPTVSTSTLGPPCLLGRNPHWTLMTSKSPLGEVLSSGHSKGGQPDSLPDWLFLCPCCFGTGNVCSLQQPKVDRSREVGTSAGTEHIHVLIQPSLADIDIAASPFIIAIKLAHIQVLPDLVNALLLVFVLSATNSGKYIVFIRRPSLTQSTDT